MVDWAIHKLGRYIASAPPCHLYVPDLPSAAVYRFCQGSPPRASLSGGHWYVKHPLGSWAESKLDAGCVGGLQRESS